MTNFSVEIIKKTLAFFLGFLNSVLFYFFPIAQLVEVLFLVFVLSYLIGTIHSIRIQQESISKTKTFTAVKEFAIYTILLAGLYVIGERMSANSAMLTIITTITWGLIYIYTTNIFKNLTRLMPYAKGLKWIYFVLNLEFIRRVPGLKEFEEKEKENENDK